MNKTSNYSTPKVLSPGLTFNQPIKDKLVFAPAKVSAFKQSEGKPAFSEGSVSNIVTNLYTKKEPS